jgi:ATP-binding cassette subfamily B protein
VNARGSGYRDLLATYLAPRWPRVLALALLLFGSIGLDLANPLILRHAIDAARAGHDLSGVTGAAALFILLAIVTQALAVVETYMAESVGWGATNSLRADLALHLLRLDLSFHNRRMPGELIERVDGDVTLLANFFARFAVAIVGNALLLAGVLVLLFGVDARVGLALTAFALVGVVVMARLRTVALPHVTAARQQSAAFFGFVGEALAGTEDIRSSGATGYVMRRLSLLLRAWLRVQRRAGVLGYTAWMASLVLVAMGTALAFALGAYLYKGGAITLGTVYLIYGYTELLRRPTEGLRTQIQDLQQAGASIGRVDELFRTTSRLSDEAGASARPEVSLPDGALAVEFRDVAFGYGEEPILRDVTFTLKPGRVLGLLGRTGSGKTSLIRLLPRLYDVDRGAVLLGGVDIRAAPLAEVRRRVGLVTQEVQLFAASVRDNLTFFDAAVPDERVVRALDGVGLGDWYRALPAGLDTALAAHGGGLSAGEAQLLSFARVFLRNPGLVILDEASSRLDPATEALIGRATEALVRGRTAIIVAHRPGTVRRADEIMILDGGRIAEHGPRDSLAGDPDARFHGLLRDSLEAIPP